MKRRIIVCVLAISVFFVLSCSNPTGTLEKEPEETIGLEYGVYVLGTDSTKKACFWVDGNLRYVPGLDDVYESSVHDILAYGDKIYIVGTYKLTSSASPLIFYWEKGPGKTGAPVRLNSEEYSASRQLEARAVNGEIIIYQTEIDDPVGSGVYIWKTGKTDPKRYAVPPPTGAVFARANCSGTELYFNELREGTARHYRCQIDAPAWSFETTEGSALGGSEITVAGNSINFRGGYVFMIVNAENPVVTRYLISDWNSYKKMIELASPAGDFSQYPTIVAVSGNFAYFAGTNGTKTYYWKWQIGSSDPAAVTELTQFGAGGSVKAMTVDGEDLYFAGLKAASGDYCYWKNNTETVLPGATEVSKILVYTE